MQSCFVCAFCSSDTSRYSQLSNGCACLLRFQRFAAALDRPTDVPDFGLMCDLMWADPEPDMPQGWAESDRGVSFVFSYKTILDFNKQFDLALIVRGHQVVEDGYEFHANRNLVTIFSAPNYCGEFDNAGGILTIDENMVCSFKIIKPSSERRTSNYK